MADEKRETPEHVKRQLEEDRKAREQSQAEYAERMHFYGIAGLQNNETPYAELRAEITCDLGAIEYEPRVEDMLETIHVETVHPPGDTENQHVFSVYDMGRLTVDRRCTACGNGCTKRSWCKDSVA